MTGIQERNRAWLAHGRGSVRYDADPSGILSCLLLR